MGNIPDISQGFGRVNVLATVGPFDAGTTVTFQDEVTLLDTNQEEPITVPILPGANQLKVTLVWTDSAGESLRE